jgi:hypothetical protein
VALMEKESIFLAKAIQDADGGNYIRTWKEKIVETFSSCSIIDLSEIEKQIVEDGNSVVEGNYKYGKEWRSWEDLYKLERKYFFSIIDDCDIVIVAESWNHPRRGKYTAKTIIEMEYALSKGKKVFGINIEDWKFKEITKEDLVKIKKEKDDEIIFVNFLRRSL